MSKSVAFLSSLLITIAAPSIAEPIPVNTPDKVTQGTTDIAQTVQHFTVQVITDQSRGSGTLLAKKGKTFLVLTHLNVLRGTQTAQIKTFDGQLYTAKVLNNSFGTNIDLALLEFTSSHNYEVPEISQASPQVGWRLVTGGYTTSKGTFQVGNGQLQQVSTRSSNNDGLVYSNVIEQGMDGGPIFERDDLKLVGINGMSGANEGVSIQKVLAEVNSEIATVYSLPAALGSSDVQVVELTENLLSAMKTSGAESWDWFNGKWMQELKPKTRHVTVRIDSNSNHNGSGVIISKNGNTYTILTANHVICEKLNTYDCQKFVYTILTYDGKKHSAIPSSIIRQNGVDLAVVKFDSSTLYPVATLANYNPKSYAFVLAAGYPRIKKEEEARFVFSSGFVLDQVQGFLSVRAIHPEVKETANILKQASYAEGYELVYTNITFGGMSGGPIFDIQGRVIGIHGSAEGETDTKIELIQLGNSLGIPITTFMGILPKFNLSADQIKIESNVPQTITDEQLKGMASVTVLTRIPEGRASDQHWIQRGDLLRRQLRFDEAIKAFDQAIALNTKIVYLAYYGKGEILASFRRSPKCIEAFEAAVKSNPNYLPALASLSVALREYGHYDRALVVINQAIQRQSKQTGKNANLYNEKWAVLEGLSKYPEALEAITRAIAIAPHSIYFTNRGTTYYYLKEYSKAIADYNNAIDLNPRLASAYSNRRATYSKLKEFDKAISDHNKAIQLSPEDNFVYRLRGDTYLEIGELEKAITDYTKAIQFKSDDDVSYYNRGNTYFTSKQYEKAIADYNKAIQVNPKLAEAYYNRGNTYITLQQYEKAISDYTKAIQINPKLAEAYGNRGGAYSFLKQYQNAITSLSQAIQLNPNEAKFFNNRGTALSEIGEVEKANLDWDRAIQINPQYASPYINRGVAYSKSDDQQKAITAYDRAIQISPESYPEAYSNRSIAHMRKGDKISAVADLEKSISLLKQQGRSNEIKDFLKESEKIIPILQKEGRATEAQEYLQELKRLQP
jgi:tetratricopeptide (TPR) repeat protein